MLVDGIKYECGQRFDIVVAKADVDVECHVKDYVQLVHVDFWTETTGNVRSTVTDIMSVRNNNTCMHNGTLETHTVSLDPGITLVKCTTGQHYRNQYCEIAIIRGH